MRKSYFIFFIIINVQSLFSQVQNWDWVRRIGGQGDETATGICFPVMNGFSVCGNFTSDTLKINTSVLINAGKSDCYVSKYDIQGNLLWAKSFGGADDDYVVDVEEDLHGCAIVSGYFNSPSIKIGDTIINGTGGNDAFVAKFDRFGFFVWARRFAGNGGNVIPTAIYAFNNDVIIVGYYDSPTLSFDALTIQNKGAKDAFVVSLNDSLKLNWAYCFGDSLDEVATGITYNVNYHILGYFKSRKLIIKTDTLINAGTPYADLFITGFSNAGLYGGSVRFGGALDEIGCGINRDAFGNFILTGSYTTPTLTIGSSTLINQGNKDVFTCKFNSNLSLIWAKSGGGIYDDYPHSIEKDYLGNIAIIGHTESQNVTFGTANMQSNGSRDGFVVVYDYPGNVTNAFLTGGTGDDEWNSLFMDGYSGEMYIVGNFNSPTISVGSHSFTSLGKTDALVGKIKKPTGIEENSVTIPRVFPNPVTEKIFIDELKPISRVLIIDVFGRLIFEKEIISQNINEIDLSKLQSGIYFMQISNKETKSVHKLIKQ